jgi:hypothetical protein
MSTLASVLLSRPARVANLQGWCRMGAYLSAERIKVYAIIRDFSIASGISWQRVRDIETGRSSPFDHELLRYARELRLDGGALCTWAAQIRGELAESGYSVVVEAD